VPTGRRACSGEWGWDWGIVNGEKKVVLMYDNMDQRSLWQYRRCDTPRCIELSLECHTFPCSAGISVLKSSPVRFFYLETKQLATATSLDLSRY
jgi:hypothetical protein